MIYIVEDDLNIQEIELFALKNSGYQAVGFATAKEFYKALEIRTPELILLDIMLPDEDGMSILKKLRMRADTQKVPVILVTAKATEIDKVKGLDGGADDYIGKPFGVMEMIARVKALLRRSGGGSSSRGSRPGFLSSLIISSKVGTPTLHSAASAEEPSVLIKTSSSSAVLPSKSPPSV